MSFLLYRNKKTQLFPDYILECVQHAAETAVGFVCIKGHFQIIDNVTWIASSCAPVHRRNTKRNTRSPEYLPEQTYCQCQFRGLTSRQFDLNTICVSGIRARVAQLPFRDARVCQ